MKIIYITLALLGGAMLLVILAAATVGIIAQALNQEHTWEEWQQERPEDGEGKDS